MKPEYESSIKDLASHIKGLIPNNPEILDFQSTFQLFDVEDFKGTEVSGDLTLAMATAALSLARREYTAAQDQQAK